MNPTSEESPPTAELDSLSLKPEERKINCLFNNTSFPLNSKPNFMDRCQKKFKSNFVVKNNEKKKKEKKKKAVPILEKLTPDYFSLKPKLKFGEISPQHDEYSQYQEKEIIGEVKTRFFNKTSQFL